MAIKTLLQETHAEAAEVLHNARQAQIEREITYEQYTEIRQSVFDACAASVIFRCYLETK